MNTLLFVIAAFTIIYVLPVTIGAWMAKHEAKTYEKAVVELERQLQIN